MGECPSFKENRAVAHVPPAQVAINLVASRAYFTRHPVQHNDFFMGLEFWCGDKRWRCTDVGSRVVVAISLEPREVVSISTDPHDKSQRTETRFMSDDARDLNGPPYGVVEHVFDEDDVEACSLVPTSDEG